MPDLVETKSRWRSRVTWLAWMLMLAVVLPTGCSKEDIAELSDSIQEQAKKLPGAPMDALEEVLPETGKITLNSTTPIETNQAIATVYVVGDGRKNSLQVTSYDPGASVMGSPAVFIQAQTDIETIALASGNPLSCTMYVEPNIGGTTYRNDLATPVQVKFESVNIQEKTVQATISPCSLISNDGTPPMQVAGGTILAVVKGN